MTKDNNCWGVFIGSLHTLQTIDVKLYCFLLNSNIISKRLILNICSLVCSLFANVEYPTILICQGLTDSLSTVQLLKITRKYHDHRKI